jgi:hypothetical protein
MIFGITIETILIILTVIGFVCLILGFSWIKILAILLGFVSGFLISNSLLNGVQGLDETWVIILSVLAGLILALFLFNFYIIVPFVLGVFLIYIAGAMLLSTLQIIGERYHFLLFGVLGILGGIAALIYKDYFMIIWTSIFGSFLITVSLGIMIFGEPSDIDFNLLDKTHENFVYLFKDNSLTLIIAFFVLLILGLLIQFLFTCHSQVFIKKMYKGKHRVAK